MLLLKSQKNGLFEMIVSAGLSPLQFDIVEEGKKTIISFKNDKYFFEFWGDFVTYSPGDKRLEEVRQISKWTESLPFFTVWLCNLRYEVEQPDKWAEVLEASKQVEWKVPDEDNTKFSYQEVLEIEASLNLIKSKIVPLGLIPQQLTLINERVDYLCDKAKSLGRVDWKNIVIGTLITLILQLALPPETSKVLWTIFGEIFKHYLLISVGNQ